MLSKYSDSLMLYQLTVDQKQDSTKQILMTDPDRKIPIPDHENNVGGFDQNTLDHWNIKC